METTVAADSGLGDDRPLPLAQRLAEEVRRLRKAAGLSQPQLAALIGYTRQYVSLAERPNKGLPSAELVRAIDDALQAGGVLEALRQQADTERKTCRPGTSPVNAAAAAGAGRAAAEDLAITYQGAVVTGASGRPSDDMELGHELLGLLSMAGVLVAAPDLDDQLDSDRLDHFPPKVGPLDEVSVDESAVLNTHLWRVFVLSKRKRAVFPLVRSQLDALTMDLKKPRGLARHQRLCALASELLQLAGEIFFDANRYMDAAHCYTLATTASKEAGAFDLWACAMARHAFIEMYEGRFGRVVSMLDLAACLARRGDQSLSTRYWVSAVQAHAFAGLGEVDACRRALDVAEEVNGLSDDASNGGWLRFDGSRLAEERGACYVKLRSHDLAEATLGEALRQNLSSRRRGSVLTDLAMIGAQRCDTSQLVTYADAALEIATQTGSGFISRKLLALQGHLVPLLGSRGVRQLNHEIMTLSGGFRT
ncbi:MAG: helix-turn-helix transcriptional regulator [Pseudonocardiaceae bacterium]